MNLDMITNTLQVKHAPILGGAYPSTSDLHSNNSNSTATLQGPSNGKPKEELHTTNYQFDKLLPPATNNAQVYATSVSPLIHVALSGYNATILTYGQTGAGKTFTTFGPTGADAAKGGYDMRGIAARSIGEVFQEIYKQRACSSVVRAGDS